MPTSSDASRSATGGQALKVAAISMTTTEDKPANIAAAVAAVRSAAAQGAQWVQLPEMFAFMGPYAQVYAMAERDDGPLYATLAALARELQIVLIAGSVGERPYEGALPQSVLFNAQGERRVYNTTYVFGRNGACLAKYRKIHLFNLNLQAEAGQTRYCESDGFIPGDQPATLMIDGLRVALSICYDLRFPELYQVLAAGGAPDVILVPSAFTKATGEAHWELLLRARAVEWQAYVFAANQTGTHSPGKTSFGHSLLIDPWGSVVASTAAEPGLAIGTLDPAVIRATRARLPALVNRRPEIYAQP